MSKEVFEDGVFNVYKGGGVWRPKDLGGYEDRLRVAGLGSFSKAEGAPIQFD